MEKERKRNQESWKGDEERWGGVKEMITRHQGCLLKRELHGLDRLDRVHEFLLMKIWLPWFILKQVLNACHSPCGFNGIIH
jgi:hypothetical protein